MDRRSGETRARLRLLGLVVIAAIGAAAMRAGAAPPAPTSFVNFESAHVRPLALSPDGDYLYAVNTPDNRLEIFAVGKGSLVPLGEAQVGLEPVAVAARAGGEVWVVNHLSDSISVIDAADPRNPRVIDTLLVGDEPRDIVFGRADRSRAFVTCAHRGQNRPGDPQLMTEGIGRADVWVFDAADRSKHETILQFFGDTPRALAVDPRGSPVYVAVFHSGNRTTSLYPTLVRARGGSPPAPAGATPDGPSTALIVKFDPIARRWEDERGAAGPDWSAVVPFSLPDEDVFVIDAEANPPAPAAGKNFVAGVGTVLFNMAVRPGNGKVFVSNLEARNHVRFEPLIDAERGVQGHIAESRITVIDGTRPRALHLNPHIDYTVATGSRAEAERSLAFPLEMAFTRDGRTLYVAAFGSNKVARFDAGDLENENVLGNGVQIEVGGGPTGLALDEPRRQLFVMNRFDHSISIVDTEANRETKVFPLRYDPTPTAARAGRSLLYDARRTSGHGDSACASCHVFGDVDGLAWDLGDPFGPMVPNPNPFALKGPGGYFHPLKGPMTTQSLRGIVGAGPMHWRGDRTGGSHPGGDSLDASQAFREFNRAFRGLQGRAAELPAPDLQALTDFALTLAYPPNPIRALDNSLTVDEARGRDFFESDTIVEDRPCVFCHRGPLGTEGLSAFPDLQEFKIPHLRNLYTKVGRFGTAEGLPFQATGRLGPQIRGFGVQHNGSLSLHTSSFAKQEAFFLAFDTGLRPIVGQQRTLARARAESAVIDRIDLLLARADAGDCEVVVKGVRDGLARGWLYVGGGLFRSDRRAEPAIDRDAIAAEARRPGQERTFTAVPPGSGRRIAIDRDEDGFFDRDELDAGSDPADPGSVPRRFGRKSM